jgi:hypothetical protein
MYKYGWAAVDGGWTHVDLIIGDEAQQEAPTSVSL